MKQEEGRITALRGAVRVRNEGDDIRKQLVLLYDELLESNGLGESDIISLVFSVTPGLDALNPAAALRQSGRAGELAMMVFPEAVFAESLPGIIRLLAHCRLENGREARHIYRNGAEVLRPDRA